MTKSLNHHSSRYNPIHVAAACATLVLALVMLLDPLFPPSPASQANAVGGYAAESVIGPDDFTGAPTWEFVFFPASTVEELVSDDGDDVIYGVGGNFVYRCDMTTLCDEEADWATYSIGAFQHESIAIDSVNQTLYVGNTANPGELYRCDITATDCDDSGDWIGPVMTFDFFAGAEHIEALIVADGFLFVGAQAFFNDSFFYSCPISSGCDDAADFSQVLGDHGGRVWRFGFDPVSGIVFAGHSDSNGSGYLLICNLSTGCNEDTDWVGGPAAGIVSPVRSFAMDEDTGFMYVGTSAGTTEVSEETPASIVRCDTSTGCDDGGDWTTVYGGFEGATSIYALHWEPNSGVLYAGSGGGPLLRCDVDVTDCDENGDWTIADQSAGEFAFAQDTLNGVLHSVGNSAYRCELVTGCDAFSELNAPEGAAYDSANSRLFVADQENNRILVYDLSGGIVDGEAPVHVLGQDDFSSFGCGTDEASLCEPVGLDYTDGPDQLFVADTGNNRVLVFDVATIDDGEDAINVLGQANFTGSDCNRGVSPAADTLCGPRSVNRDSNNDRIYVADTENNRVLAYDASGGITNGMAAANVFGQADLVSVDCNRGGGPAANTLCDPSGVTYDGDNQRLFVADNANARVLAYEVTAIADGEDATNVLGQPDPTTVSAETDENSLTSAYAVNSDGDNARLFVSDPASNRVMIWDTTSITDGMDAVDVIGQSDFVSSGSGLTDEALDGPSHIAIGDGESVFVADQNNNRVLLFTVPVGGGGGGGPSTGHLASDVIGQLTGADLPIFTEGGVDNSPNSRGFSGPEGVTIDAVNHRLFEVDPGNHRVMVFNLDTDNQLIDRIADHVLGQLDFRSNGNGTDQAKMTYPLYSAYDPDNDLLFVSDYSNNRVMVFDVENITDGENAIHVLGQPDFTTTTVVLSDTGMSNPRGVAYDPTTSRLFVGSQDHQRVLVYDLLGGITNGMAASWVLGQEDFNSSGPNLDQDGLSAGNSLTLDIDGQRLFVDDSAFSRVMVFDISTITNGQDAINVIGQEDFTSGGSDLDQNSLDFSGIYGNGLAYDADNDRLFVGDGSNRRVVVFDADLSVLVPLAPSDPCVVPTSCGPDAINVLGQPDFSSEDDSLSQHSTRAAGGLVYDADNGLLYTTTKGDVGQENPDNRSSIFDVNPGTITDGEDAVDLLGQLDENDAPFYTSRGVDNTPNQLGFDSSHGVAIDQVNHRLFAADFNNNRVLVFNLDADNSPNDYAADFVIGQPDFKSTASAADDPQAYNFNNGPQSVLYHEENNWLIVNDANGNRVLVFDMAALANGMSALYVLGQPDFTTHDCCNVSDHEFVSSEGIALDPDTNFLYVPDGIHNRVLVFDLSTISNGMNASFVLGQPDFITEDVNTGPDGMESPRGAAVDSINQRLFVSDNGNRRVLVFDTSVLSNGLAAMNVLGQDDFTSSENEVSQARIPDPAGLAYDSERNRLFVADPNTSRVTVFDTTAIADGEDAVDAYGQGTFTDSGCNTTRSGLCVPEAVFYDEDRNTLYVADSANNRVLIFGPTGGGNPQSTPEPVGITPDRIVVNQDSSVTDSRNVLVTVWATNTANFTGTVDVLLSNDPMFSTFIPFRYNVPGPSGEQNIWPKTIAWDLCFGLSVETCDSGHKTVYARFYVNVPLPSPVLTPRPVQ